MSIKEENKGAEEFQLKEIRKYIYLAMKFGYKAFNYTKMEIFPENKKEIEESGVFKIIDEGNGFNTITWE